MINSIHNLNSRVTAIILLYLVTTAVLLIGSLSLMLNGLARTQLNELGNALVAQLTETLKQPVINSDVISMQVILDNLLADTPVIARATVYSTSNRILAQSQRLSPVVVETSAYVRPISVDDNMMAQLRLEMDEDTLFSQYRFPIWMSMSLWLLLTGALGYYLIDIARNYSDRISKLNSGFNGKPDSASAEITQLESALAPFMLGKKTGMVDEQDTPGSYAMLAVSIPNLPKWRAQLNAAHFTSMLSKVDSLIDEHLALFKGSRIQSQHTTMLIQFEDTAGEQPIQRALTCASALLQLSSNLISDQEMPFEMRITAAFRQPVISGSRWYRDLSREECINRLLDILPLAGPWELVIDKKDLDEGNTLDNCDLEDLNAASVWQFRNFSGQRQDTFYKQLEFLTATLR